MKPIDADALREKFADVLNSTYTDDYAKVFVAGLYAAMNMPTLTPPNEWVSVEERLPKEKQRVIVRCERVGTSVGWILWGRWMTDIGPHAGDVTHWMPLPAAPDRRPPEGEEDI